LAQANGTEERLLVADLEYATLEDARRRIRCYEQVCEAGGPEAGKD
jgi:hypothetical protein